MGSHEIRAADAALTALHEAQQEVARLSEENDRLLIELEQAVAIGRTLLSRCEAADAVCSLARAAAAASLFPGRGPLVGALAAYDAVVKAREP